MTRAQARALAEIGPDLMIDPRTGMPDWGGEFGRSAPLGVEIGFGNGYALLDWAAQCPDWNLIGIDVYQPGIGALLLGVERLALSNVRVIAEDARRVFAGCFASASVAEARIFFPDPWPKKRHHKRRLVQPEFVSNLTACMQIDGRLWLATDWQDYAEAMLEILDDEPRLTNLAGSGRFFEGVVSRSLTRFEERGRNLGHPVWDLAYVRNR